MERFFYSYIYLQTLIELFAAASRCVWEPPARRESAAVLSFQHVYWLIELFAAASRCVWEPPARRENAAVLSFQHVYWLIELFAATPPFSLSKCSPSEDEYSRCFAEQSFTTFCVVFDIQIRGSPS